MQSQAEALIVSPDQYERQRLKEALQASGHFLSSAAVRSLEAAALFLEENDELEVLFISQQFTADDAAAFIAHSKQTLKGRDAAYIMLLDNRAESDTISSALIRGADGFLLEPYSVDALSEITALAALVKKEKQAARFRGALNILLGEIGDQLDRASAMKKRGYPACLSIQMLAEMCGVLRELPPDVIPGYYAQLTEIFAQAEPAPEDDRRDSWHKVDTASRRVHQRVSARALERVKKAIAMC